ncbi:MAG: ABC transporter permease [Nitrospirales bacterium]|nr:MAG: ABC transporter permease [Nitrospirales bacterium]
MSVLDHWEDIFLSVRRHKLRAFLTAFGVFWGIFMVVLLLGIGTGLERGMLQIFKDDALNSVWVESGKTSVPFDGLLPGRPITLNIQDLDLLQSGIPGIENITPRIELKTKEPVTFERQSGSFPILAIAPGYHVVERTQLLSGRLMNELDTAEGRRIAVIGSRVAQLLFNEDEDPVGQRITIEGTNYLVVGVFTDVGGEGELRRIYIPYTAYLRSFNPNPEVTFMIFTVKDGYHSVDFESHVRTLLAKRHRFAPTDYAAVGIWNSLDEYLKFQALFGGIHLFVGIVGLGTLCAGLIGVTNVMFIAVKERTREIGIRKTIGATPPKILTMILSESLVLTIVSGYLGLLAGVSGVELIRVIGFEMEYFREPEVDIGVALWALTVLIIGGIVAGYIPAQQAARINIVEALRHE